MNSTRWPSPDLQISSFRLTTGDELWFISTGDDIYLSRDGFLRGYAIPSGVPHTRESILNNTSCGYYGSLQEAKDQCERFGYTYELDDPDGALSDGTAPKSPT